MSACSNGACDDPCLGDFDCLDDGICLEGLCETAGVARMPKTAQAPRPAKGTPRSAPRLKLRCRRGLPGGTSVRERRLHPGLR